MDADPTAGIVAGSETDAKKSVDAGQGTARIKRGVPLAPPSGGAEGHMAVSSGRKGDSPDQARTPSKKKKKKAAGGRKPTVQPSVPSGMVKVPGGEFLMGCNEDVDSQCDPDEKPSRTVNVPTFYIDKTEVTVAAYGKCVEAEQCKRETFWTKDDSKYCNRGYDKRDRHPMNCVSWHGAAAYCKFVGKRLPSEAEWEKAARGTDGRKYPWGNKPSASCSRAVIDDGKTKDTAGSETDGCGRDSTWPVGSKSAGNSPFGVSDMVGNVWEWTADWYEHSSIKRGKYRSVRGGSWFAAFR